MRLLRRAARSDYPREGAIHQLFTTQAARSPDAIALEVRGTELTYRQLDMRSNQVAHRLRQLGVGRGTPVGLCAESSAELIVGVLGILKAGGAYLPLDPGYPRERLAFMLQDSGAPVLLTMRRFLESFPSGGVKALCLDADEAAFDAEPTSAPASDVGGADLAYIMYTSGSTGAPKGVCVPHRAVLRLVLHTNFIQLSAADCVAQAASFSFDAATFELWGALLHGARLVVVPREVKLTPRSFASFLVERRISVLFVTTALFNQVAAEMPEAYRHLRQVHFGGEAVDPRWVREVLAKGRPGKLLHVYGPTESTTFASWHEVRDVPADAGTVPIGGPLANTELCLLGPDLQPVPVGEPGELYIGGDGLSWGYLRRPELTAERFIPHPFSPTPGERLYRTGDIARWLPDGSLEFIGRRDAQVKIRGFRIELGEIEAVLLQHPAVREAVVVAREDQQGDRRLVAYAVPKPDSLLPPGGLRSFLADKLPDHMVPSAFVRLEALPLTRNGKVDRAALPPPDTDRPEVEQDFVAPRSDLEEKLAGIWCELFGLERIGVYDDFFELGGHSLLATKCAARIRKVLRVELPLEELFAHPTVAELAQWLSEDGGEGDALPPVRIAPRGGDLPLSFPQEQVWFLNELAPGSVAYHFQMSLQLEGPLQVDVLRRALTEVVRRHEILRTTFPARDGRPIQVIHPPPEGLVALPVVDVSAHPSPDDEVERLVAEELRRTFDVSRLPLIRWTLFRLAPQRHVFLQVEHHFLHDGWSIGVLLREVQALYGAFAQGKPSPLPELSIQYADFAAWQRQWLQGDVLQGQLGFWRKKLAGAPPALELPTDHPRPRMQSFRGREHWSELSPALYASLKELCRRQGTTFFILMQAAFLAFLKRYTGQADICIGSAVANRRLREAEQLIGMIVNTVILRADLSGDPRFSEHLRHVRSETLDCYANQDIALMTLVKELQPDRDLSRYPLFQILFSFHDSAMPDIELGDASGWIRLRGNDSAKCDINVIVIPELRVGTGANARRATFVRWEYSTDLFEAETVQRMAQHYLRLLEGVAAHPDLRLSELPMLGEDERRQLASWNDTRVDHPVDTDIQRLFEAQVEQTPDAVAVESEGRALSYRELNGRANRLAWTLVARGVGPDSVVALLDERGDQLLTAILAVFKAGGAYLPLDPRHPPQRIAQVLAESGARWVIAPAALRPLLESALQALPASSRPEVLDPVGEPVESETGNPPVRATPRNLAYVIFTSGSTGLPKGAMVERRGMVNHLYAKVKDLSLGPADVVAQTASQCFDISVWQMLVALVVGGRTCILSDEVAYQPSRLLAALAERQVTVVELVPSVLRALAEELEQLGKGSPELSRLRWMVSTGEALAPELCAQWLRLYPGVPVVNAYGPTECSDDVTHHFLHEAGTGSSLPVGRPVSNTRAYVLDAAMREVPVGVPGELYFGGTGVGRGYLNRPELTADRFVPDPFSSQPGDRLYRTGDLGRRRADGTLEYLGRIDYQVKIRGHRIELDEIEAVLRKHPALREVVVVARDDARGDKSLVAYVVAAGEPPGAAALRNHVKALLPEYMVPAAFVEMAALPLTSTGKVDRQALPAPGVIEQAETFVAPRTETEQAVARIWQQVLNREKVGVHDNFFHLGGHSLLAAQLASRLRSAFNVDMPLRQVFDGPTIADLAQAITRFPRIDQAPMEAAQRSDLLASIDQLSDAEVSALLGTMSQEQE